MIRRFLVIALLAIGATVSHAQQSLPSSFRQKPFTARKQRTSSCAGEERGRWLCSFTDMRKTATHGLLCRRSYEGSHRCGAGPSWNWEVIKA